MTVRKSVDEWTENGFKKIAYQLAIDKFRKMMADPDPESYGHYSRLVDIFEEMKADLAPHVLSLDEVLGSCGSGWCENWFPADEEDGTPEGIEVCPVAWCHGSCMFDSASVTEREALIRCYNKRYGMRFWSDKPTDQQRDNVPWSDGEFSWR